MNTIPSKLLNLIPKRIVKTPEVSKGVSIYSTTCDVFEKKDSVKDVAVAFKKNIIDAYSDWETCIPFDKEEGATFLKKNLAQYTLFVDQLSSVNAERFSKLVFGEKQIQEFKNAAKVNSDVSLFVETLEKSLGKTLENIIEK